MDTKTYRIDIDGLRAIAVFSVILFHLGFLPGGYLGVDVFFVISGFLITGIIHPKMISGKFSFVDFYIRRIRRILPLAALISLIALVVGVTTMLPDDLENLAQSVIATNAFSNNILEYLKRLDYWGIVNDYKPLMHTWSLGVEEQFYFVYPFLLLLFRNRFWSLTVPALYFVTVISFSLFLLPGFDPMSKFYLPVFRFWELSAGGLAAIHLNGRVFNYRAAPISLFGLLGILVFSGTYIPNTVALPLAVILTIWVLSAANDSRMVTSVILCNPVAVFLGKISYSLYMWHQVVFAFARYFWKQELNMLDCISLLILIFILSIVTYYLIEQPFREKKRVPTAAVIAAISVVYLITTFTSLYLVRISGILKDVPELDLNRATATYGQHSRYNDRIYKFDRPFQSDKKLRVLVIGDSFARDWANVLLESNYVENIEISYVCWIDRHPDATERMKNADIIFASRTERSLLESVGAPLNKVWAIGTKNYGSNTGYFYNQKGPKYFEQRTEPHKETFTINKKLRAEWGERFIDLLEPILDENKTVPVFTSDKKFISQDTNHLTRAGARFYAALLEGLLSRLIGNERLTQ